MFESKPYFSPNSWSKTWRLPTPTLSLSLFTSARAKRSLAYHNRWRLKPIISGEPTTLTVSRMIVNVIHIPMVVGTIPIKSPSVGGFNPSEKTYESQLG